VRVDRRLLALGAAAALLGFAGCGESKLDSKKVEKAIKQGIERENPGTKVVSVACPSDRKLKTGDTFKCQVRGAKPSQRALATVTQTNGKGSVHYSVP
jgi:hypothetical protein